MDPEPTEFEFQPEIDTRPRMAEPLPVRLQAVEDVRAFASGGLETQLDDFYASLLGLEREAGEAGQIIYRAENFRLRLEVVDTLGAPDDFQPILIDVPSLPAVREQLIDREIEFQLQQGLPPAQETLLLQDPAGNWVQIGQFRRI